MAVNVIGNEVEDNNNSVSPDGEGGQVPSRRGGGGGDGTKKDEEEAEFPPYHDLAFSMYVDTEVTGIIQQLDLKRQAAGRG